MACQDKSSGGSDPGPTPTPEPPRECAQVLQNLKLNETLRLTDLDSTALFIKNNAQELQRLEAEEAAAVWACLDKGS
jgi:hypothetical protein